MKTIESRVPPESDWRSLQISSAGIKGEEGNRISREKGGETERETGKDNDSQCY